MAVRAMRELQLSMFTIVASVVVGVFGMIFLTI